jgi:hypothetical protein
MRGEMNLRSEISRRGGGSGSIRAQSSLPNSTLVAKESADPGSTKLAHVSSTDSTAQKKRDAHSPVAGDTIAEHGIAI